MIFIRVKKCTERVKQASAWFLVFNPSEWWMVFINKTWNIFIMNVWKIANTPSASRTDRRNDGTLRCQISDIPCDTRVLAQSRGHSRRGRLHVAAVSRRCWGWKIRTWMSFKNTANGACSYSSGKLFYDIVFTESRSTQTFVCWFLILRLIRNQTQESTSIEWIHAQLFLCHSPGLGLTFSQSVLFELWCNRKKVFYLIWQFTNVLICFSQVKSYARLESELTLIFRRLLTHTPAPSSQDHQHH